MLIRTVISYIKDRRTVTGCRLEVVYVLTLMIFAGCFGVSGLEEEYYKKTLNGDIPVIWKEPKGGALNRPLIIWLDGFTGKKENTVALLSELTDLGYVALSFDAYLHGDRRKITDNLWERAFSKNEFRNTMWPIIGRSVEDASVVIDWAIEELGVNGDIGIGGFSMGGDISIAAAGVDGRIKCVVALVSAPDWRRSNMTQLHQPLVLVDQGEANVEAQRYFDRYNPSTNVGSFSNLPAVSFEMGAKDLHIPVEGAREFVHRLKREYDGVDARIVEHDCGHEFYPAMWSNAKFWFNEHLIGSGQTAERY